MSLTVVPALDQLIRHTRLFGTECVYETGEQEGLVSADLARLRIELDELDAGRKSRRGFSIGKRRRRSSDETRDAVLALSVMASCRRRGISDRTVRGYLKQSGATAFEGVQDLPKAPDFWLNQAADLAAKRHPRGNPHSGPWAIRNGLSGDRRMCTLPGMAKDGPRRPEDEEEDRPVSGGGTPVPESEEATQKLFKKRMGETEKSLPDEDQAGAQYTNVPLFNKLIPKKKRKN